MKCRSLIAPAVAGLLLTGCGGLSALSTGGGGGAVSTDPEVLAQGAAVYDVYCIACHGPNGRGTGWETQNLTVQPPDLNGARIAMDPETMRFIVSHGRAQGGGEGMPMHGAGILSEPAIDAVVAYVRAGLPASAR